MFASDKTVMMERLRRTKRLRGDRLERGTFASAQTETFFLCMHHIREFV
jgi:hypothetical protein